jgi:hypothetical protein
LILSRHTLSIDALGDNVVVVGAHNDPVARGDLFSMSIGLALPLAIVGLGAILWFVLLLVQHRVEIGCHQCHYSTVVRQCNKAFFLLASPVVLRAIVFGSVQ